MEDDSIQEKEIKNGKLGTYIVDYIFIPHTIKPNIIECQDTLQKVKKGWAGRRWGQFDSF